MGISDSECNFTGGRKRKQRFARLLFLDSDQKASLFQSLLQELLQFQQMTCLLGQGQMDNPVKQQGPKHLLGLQWARIRPCAQTQDSNPGLTYPSVFTLRGCCPGSLSPPVLDETNPTSQALSLDRRTTSLRSSYQPAQKFGPATLGILV